MVKKLFKHEFIALGRIFLPAGLIVFAVSLLSSLTLLLQSNNVVYVQLQAAFIGLFTLAVTCFFVLAFILCAMRFYQSLFSKEGYMTLSLPVTPMQILFVKLTVSAIALIFSFLVSVLSVEIFATIQGIDVIGSLISAISEIELDAGIIFYALFVMFISVLSSLLFLYACMSAGQLFNKNRSLAIAGLYIGINELLNILFSVIFLFIVPLLDGILQNMSFTGYRYIQLSLSLAQALIIGVASVFFIRYILKNKVNLLA